MAVFFGLQSLQAFTVFGWFAQIYRDAGFSASTAGLLLGIITAMSIPLSFAVSSLAARLHDQSWLVTALVTCGAFGYLGLILAPARGAWVWAVAVGAGASVFPFALTLIGLRARTDEGNLGAVWLHPVGRLPHRGDRSVGGRCDVRRDRWLDGAAGSSAIGSVAPLAVGPMVARPVHMEDQLRLAEPG
jgi:CP family cyanate transporter-like MFS transporter